MTQRGLINRRAVLLVAVGLAVGALTPIVEAAKKLVLPKNSVRTEHIVNRTIQPGDLSKATIDYLIAGAPEPKGSGVSVTYGAFEGKFRVIAPRLTGGTKVVAQIEYLGGLCALKVVRVDGAFFAGSGLIVDTDSWEARVPVPERVRLPLELKSSSAEAAARAEIVLSRADCVTPPG
jgi:hypothetical protein